MVDFNKLGSIAVQQAQSEEDKRNKRLVALTTRIDRVLTDDPHSSIVEAFEILLKIKPGEVTDVLNKLGINVDDAGDATPALPAPSRAGLADFWRVYESDGSTIATDIDWVKKDDNDAIVRLGLVPLLDPATGDQTGLKKRPTPAPAPSAPASADDGDREVPVKDTKDRVVKQIKVKDGRNDRSLKAEIGDDGKVTGFKQLSRLGRR